MNECCCFSQWKTAYFVFGVCCMSLHFHLFFFFFRVWSYHSQSHSSQSQVQHCWRFHIVYHAWSLCHRKYSSGNLDCLNAHCHKNHPPTVWCYSRVQFMCSFCVCVCVYYIPGCFGGVLEIVQWSLFLNFLLCWYLMLSLVYSGDRMLS